MWELQNETRRLKNKAIQLLWEWNGFSSDYKEKYGEYPSAENQAEILSYKSGMRGYLYDFLKNESTMNTS